MLCRTTIVALAAVFNAPADAASNAAYDRCIQRLCTSTTQDDCWIKAAAAMCDRDQIQCRELPDQAPAKVVRRVGERWEVQTAYGKGYVSDRMMMIDGSKCPELD